MDNIIYFRDSLHERRVVVSWLFHTLFVDLSAIRWHEYGTFFHYYRTGKTNRSRHNLIVLACVIFLN